jgi:hypothetical protein
MADKMEWTMDDRDRRDEERLDGLVEEYAGAMEALVAYVSQGGCCHRGQLAFLLEQLPDGSVNLAVQTKAAMHAHYASRDDAPQKLVAVLDMAVRDPQLVDPLVAAFVYEGEIKQDGSLEAGESYSATRVLRPLPYREPLQPPKIEIHRELLDRVAMVDEHVDFTDIVGAMRANAGSAIDRGLAAWRGLVDAAVTSGDNERIEAAREGLHHIEAIARAREAVLAHGLDVVRVEDGEALTFEDFDGPLVPAGTYVIRTPDGPRSIRRGDRREFARALVATEERRLRAEGRLGTDEGHRELEALRYQVQMGLDESDGHPTNASTPDHEILNSIVEQYAGAMEAIVAFVERGGALRRDLGFLLEQLPNGDANVMVQPKSDLLAHYARDPDAPKALVDAIAGACRDPHLLDPLVVVFAHEGEMLSDHTLDGGDTVSGTRVLRPNLALHEPPRPPKIAIHHSLDPHRARA